MMILLWDTCPVRGEKRNVPAPRKERTPRVPHDKRRIRRIRKRTESENAPGGALARDVGRRGRATWFRAAAAPHAGAAGKAPAPATVTAPSSSQKSRNPKDKWSQGSEADTPSGRFSSHTWQCSPQPSGSSEQKQRVRPQQTAASAMQPAATSAIQSVNLPLLWFTEGHYTKFFLRRQNSTERPRPP